MRWSVRGWKGQLLAGLLCLGCGDEKADEAGQTLGALTESEASDLCEELRPYMLRVATGACTAGALHEDGDAVYDCATERQACIDDSVGECNVTRVRSADNQACLDVSVADLRECITQNAEVAEAQYGEDPDCDSGLQPTSDEAPQIPAACERLARACPALGESPTDDDDSQDDDPDETPSDGDQTCVPRTPVGGCAGDNVCFEVTDPSYTPEKIENDLCGPATPTFVERCPTAGNTGRCVGGTGAYPIVQFAYIPADSARVSCGGLSRWCAP